MQADDEWFVTARAEERKRQVGLHDPQFGRMTDVFPPEGWRGGRVRSWVAGGWIRLTRARIPTLQVDWRDFPED